MNLRAALQTIIGELDESASLVKSDINVFKQDKHILIIRSASITIFKKFIDKLKMVNPHIFIHVITHSRDNVEVSNICGERCKVIEYTQSGNYSIEHFDDIKNSIDIEKIDRFVLLHNNRYGSGYENVEEILFSIGGDPLYTYNCFDEVFQIQSSELRLESSKLMALLCDWFWLRAESKSEER